MELSDKIKTYSDNHKPVSVMEGMLLRRGMLVFSYRKTVSRWIGRVDRQSSSSLCKQGDQEVIQSVVYRLDTQKSEYTGLKV